MDIRFRSPYLDTSGYGNVGRQILYRLLEDKDFNVYHERFPFMDPNMKLGSPRVKQTFQNNQISDDYIFLQHTPPNNFVYLKNKINILMTTFEMNDLPIEWLRNVKSADHIITFSEFDKSLFEKYNDNVHKIGHGVNTNIYKKMDISKFEGFSYLIMGDYNLRKGVDLTIKAFAILEKKYKDVRLIIKTYYEAGKLFEELLNRFGIKNYLLITSDLTEEELAKVYNSVNYFPFPTRGEGWGLGLHEAMACGIPAVTTKYSGVMDFTNEDSVDYLEYKMVDVSYEFIRRRPIHKGLQWAEPNFDQLVYYMEKAYKDGPDLKKVENAYRLAHSWTWDRVYNNLKKILMEV